MADLEWVWMTLVSASLSGLAAWPLRVWTQGWRDTTQPEPPGSMIPSLPPFKGLASTDFVTSHDQGAFGEALTFAYLAADGWHPINGKPGKGPQGIDGIFWRSDGASWQARLIETKTNSSALKPGQMGRNKLLKDLRSLFVLTHETALQSVYAAIYDELASGGARVAVELWRHRLSTGAIETCVLNADGAPASAIKTAFNPMIFEGLLAGAKELDRKRVIFA